MATARIVPSLQSAALMPSPIIPASFTPSIHLTVQFPQISASEGVLVRVSQVSSLPIINIFSAPTTSTSSFTFMLIDPDAPTPADPKFSFWRHWVVVNIPASTINGTANIVDAGKTLTPYLAPGPKDESGPHRYLFLVFREPEGLVLSKEDVGGVEFVDRRSFGAKEFVDKWGLELVGVQWMRGVGDGWVGEEGLGKTEL